MKRAKRKSNYPMFRQALYIDFQNISVDAKQQLGRVMQTKGYRKTGRDFENYSYPSDKQIDFAWNYLLETFPKKEIKQKYRLVRIKGYSYKRGNKTIIVKGYTRRVLNV
jgi:hypothetical protein